MATYFCFARAKKSKQKKARPDFAAFPRLFEIFLTQNSRTRFAQTY